MNCVGIDISKSKSMIAVMRPLGEMVTAPFEVGHTDAELCELPRRLGGLGWRDPRGDGGRWELPPSDGQLPL